MQVRQVPLVPWWFRRFTTTMSPKTVSASFLIRSWRRRSLPGQSRCEIDYSGPVVVVQKQLESLRAAPRRTKKWVAGLAIVACTLLVIVGIKSLFGMNVYSVVGIAGLAVVAGILAAAPRMRRFFLVFEFEGEEVVEKLQATLLRVLRRHRVLRG